MDTKTQQYKLVEKENKGITLICNIAVPGG